MNENIVKAREVLHNIGGHDYDSCGNYPLERREAEKIINILNAFISKNGEWLFTKTNFDKHGCTAECSVCHKKWKTYDKIRFEKEHEYCPKCGAIMKLDLKKIANVDLNMWESEKAIQIPTSELRKMEMGELSDGYHTFNQLYHQRAVLFACIVNQNKNKAWKSFKHADGKYCFDSDREWFIVGVDTPQGSYTYHYSKEYWDMFDCQELECGKEWDGHTEEDVTRLLSLPQEPRWIPCSDHLPEGHCLFCDIDSDIYYGHIYDNKWWAEGQNDKIKNVVAWMPLTGSIVVGRK